MPALKNTTTLIATLAATAAMAPVAGAAADHLGGSPQLKAPTAAKTATLSFAADRAPSSIAFAGGQKAGTVKRVGTHGKDRTYTVKVTSATAFRDGAKYTATFRFGKEREVRKVTFHVTG